MFLCVCGTHCLITANSSGIVVLELGEWEYGRMGVWENGKVETGIVVLELHVGEWEG